MPVSGRPTKAALLKMTQGGLGLATNGDQNASTAAGMAVAPVFSDRTGLRPRSKMTMATVARTSSAATTATAMFNRPLGFSAKVTSVGTFSDGAGTGIDPASLSGRAWKLSE